MTSRKSRTEARVERGQTSPSSQSREKTEEKNRKERNPGQDHRAQEALPLAERALAFYDGRKGTEDHEPQARFVLARALVAAGGDRQRALAEARAARDEFREAGAGQADKLAEAERWLAEHFPPP